MGQIAVFVIFVISLDGDALALDLLQGMGDSAGGIIITFRGLIQGTVCVGVGRQMEAVGHVGEGDAVFRTVFCGRSDQHEQGNRGLCVRRKF